MPYEPTGYSRIKAALDLSAPKPEPRRTLRAADLTEHRHREKWLAEQNLDAPTYKPSISSKSLSMIQLAYDAQDAQAIDAEAAEKRRESQEYFRQNAAINKAVEAARTQWEQELLADDVDSNASLGLNG